MAATTTQIQYVLSSGNVQGFKSGLSTPNPFLGLCHATLNHTEPTVKFHCLSPF